MAESQQLQSTTDSQQPQSTVETGNNLPFAIIHRLPTFNFSFSWAKGIVNPIEPSDPLYPIHRLSARAVIVLGPSPLKSEHLDQYPSVECIFGTSAGVDHIDLAECRRRNIRVTSAGDAFSEDGADYAIGLLIDVLRLVSASDRFVRAGLWPVEGIYPLGNKVGGKRVGIVGLGSIGSLVAKRLEPFGCTIGYTSRNKKPQLPYQFYSTALDLATNSDALIVCCALTEKTRHVINHDVMKALGKRGILVNVGRGALVDEKELVKLLVGGELGGAGLDVFEDEPEVPRELFTMDNVVLSPHKAIATIEAIEGLIQLVIGNMKAFFSNKPLLSQLNLHD
ncbi:glyoxylate/hydroxypyruvate reductase HPR3 [Lactuca sativa]|nr:glyoxylate/hydroxypyruvate reductase HPR3 [Lactuca sativa]